MALCFITNPTGQTQTFCYRVPGINRAVTTEVPAYKQAVLFRDADPGVLNSIIDQLAVYGVYDASSMHSGVKKNGFPVSFGEAIKAEKIDEAIEIVDDARDTQAMELRRDTAAAIGASGDATNVVATITKLPDRSGDTPARSETFAVVGQSNTSSPGEGRRRA